MTVVVAAIIQDELGTSFAANAVIGNSLAHKWEFPGGKAKPNEALEEAIVREIAEELNAKITVVREFHRNHYEDIELVSFVCDLTGPKPTTSTDHSELRWVSESELTNLDWAEADKEIVKKITIPFC